MDKKILQTNKVNKRRAKDAGEPTLFTRVLGFFLIVLVSFPFLSLLSYDWHDIPWLNADGSTGTHNLIGMAGAWGAFLGYSLFGLSIWMLPFWMLFFGFLLVMDKLRFPYRKFLWALLFQICISSIFEACKCPMMVESLGIKSAGGCLGWFFMTKCLRPLLGSVGSVQVVVAVMLLTLFFGVGWRSWCAIYRSLADWLEARRISRASESERATLEELRRFRQDARERKAAEKEKERQEREEARAAREAEKEARRREKEEKNLEKAKERLERERLRQEEEEKLNREREEAEAKRKAEAERRAAETARRAAEAERRAAEATAGNADVDQDDAEDADSSVFDTSSMADGDDDNIPEPKPFVLPTPDLLSPIMGGEADCGDTEQTAQLLTETFSEFKVPGTITHIEEGPVITTYEFQPASRIRPEQVAALDKTLEMRIKASSLRIEAPIPGKGVCGIEVPNQVARAVTVREILEGDTWKTLSNKYKLPLLLGKDASGHDLVADLADMPHLLVAGATGSGKSVCINAMLTGLLMSRTPEELKLILVDPKVVEFTGYNAIPHLVVPVITEPKKVALGLIWAIHEMDRRYKMLSAVGVKNIASFNNRKKAAVQQDMFEQFEEPKNEPSPYPDKLPYIVIVIDEMADLMLQVKKEIEDGITRLAQKSRAVGIHLVLATQRPTVNIVTGTIKANVPGRVAFQVAQKNDSKVILDRMGAESLIGKGDMLFLNPRTGKTIRAQGAFITDEDAETVTAFIRAQAKPTYSKEAQEQLAQVAPEKGQGGDARPATDDDGGGRDGGDVVPDDDTDKLYEEAIGVIKRTRRASTSSLQRALGIGYNRAARIFDQLEERGVVGPSRGALPREILIDLDGEIPTNPSQGDDEEESSEFSVEDGENTEFEEGV